MVQGEGSTPSRGTRAAFVRIDWKGKRMSAELKKHGATNGDLCEPCLWNECDSQSNGKDNA
jgi:hypothetical protein